MDPDEELLNSSDDSKYAEHKDGTMGVSGLPTWLFEIDEDDDGLDMQRPLLEELGISPISILCKIAWVLTYPWLPQRWRQRLGHDLLTESPDFWGPLLIVVLYAAVLLWGKFVAVPWVLLIWVIGSVVIRFLGQTAGSTLAHGQILAVTGYSALPLLLVGLVLVVSKPTFFNLPLQAFGIIWATKSASPPMIASSPQAARKKWIVIYPVFLLNTYLMSLYADSD